MFRLIYINGRKKGKRLLMRGGSVVIGSSEKCGIRLDDTHLAPEQALVEDRGRDIFLRDLAANGEVRINGEPVENAILHDGDEIGIGQQRMRFQTSHSISALSKKRRGNHVQRLTLAAVLALIVIEVAIIAGWMIYLERVENVPKEAAETIVETNGNVLEAMPSAPEKESEPVPPPETNLAEIVAESESQPPPEEDVDENIQHSEEETNLTATVAVREQPPPAEPDVEGNSQPQVGESKPEMEVDLKAEPAAPPKPELDASAKEQQTARPPSRPPLAELEDKEIPAKPVVETSDKESVPQSMHEQDTPVAEKDSLRIEGGLEINSLEPELVYDSANRLQRILLDIGMNLTGNDTLPQGIDGRIEIECIFRDKETGELVHSEPQEMSLSIENTQGADYAAKTSVRTHYMLSAIDPDRNRKLDYAGLKIRLYAAGELQDDSILVERLGYLLDSAHSPDS